MMCQRIHGMSEALMRGLVAGDGANKKLGCVCVSFFLAAVLSLSAVADADGVIVKDGDAIAFLGDSITAQGASKPTGYVNLVMKGLEIEGVKNAKMIPAGPGGYKSSNLLASGEMPPERYFTYDGVHMVFPGNCMMAWGVLRAFGVREGLKEKIKAAWEEMNKDSLQQSKNQSEKRS